MLVIRTKDGIEMRIPMRAIEEVQEVEPVTGVERTVAPHPYLHREGVQRCAACWRPPLDPCHR